MPTPQAGLGMNPLLALLSPDQQQNLMQLQQQQAIGQALLQQGLQPIDTSNRQVGGMGYRVSPLEGLAKLANMYVGNKISRDSMGQQAQIMGQLYGNAFGQDQQVPVAQSAPPVAASADSGGLTGPTAGMGGMQGTPSPQQLGATLQQNGVATPMQTVSTPGTFSIPGMSAAESKQLYLMAPEEYAKARMGFLTPTDATRMALAAHMDPAAANAGALFKNNFVAPITGTGIFRDPRTMQPVAYNPESIPGTTPLFDASGNQVAVQPMQGAQAALQGNAAATAAGSAQFKPIQVYNPTTHQMEYSNEAAVTNPAGAGGAAPTLSSIFAQQESSGGKTAPNNPYQIQQGTFNQYAQPGESWNNVADRNTVAQRVLATYQQKYGGDLGRIATAYFSGEGNVAPPGSPTPFLKNVSDSNGKTVASYVGDIYSRGAGTSAPGSGAPAAAPPLGATSNADAAQQASADTMKTSYGKLQVANSIANSALDALQKMQAIAANKNPALTAGALGTAVAPFVSQDAAEYEKQRANVIKLMANQNAWKDSATDAGLALTGESVPDYGKPKGAIQDGLQTQINQIRAQQLKVNVLTPVYQTGDSKAYTTLENQFDQTVKPSMMPAISSLISMPPGPQRAAALKQAIADPQMKSALDLMATTGQLK